MDRTTDRTTRAINIPTRMAALGRRRGQPRRPKQLCMQADGTTLAEGLQAPRRTERRSRARVYGKGEASGLRNSATWAEVTALVNSAQATARGTAHGGSGGKAEDLLPRDGAEGRTIYVLE